MSFSPSLEASLFVERTKKYTVNSSKRNNPHALKKAVVKREPSDIERDLFEKKFLHPDIFLAFLKQPSDDIVLSNQPEKLSKLSLIRKYIETIKKIADSQSMDIKQKATFLRNQVSYITSVDFLSSHECLNKELEVLKSLCEKNFSIDKLKNEVKSINLILEICKSLSSDSDFQVKYILSEDNLQEYLPHISFVSRGYSFISSAYQKSYPNKNPLTNDEMTIFMQAVKEHVQGFDLNKIQDFDLNKMIAMQIKEKKRADLLIKKRSVLLRSLGRSQKEPSQIPEDVLSEMEKLKNTLMIAEELNQDKDLKTNIKKTPTLKDSQKINEYMCSLVNAKSSNFSGDDILMEPLYMLIKQDSCLKTPNFDYVVEFLKKQLAAFELHILLTAPTYDSIFKNYDNMYLLTRFQKAKNIPKEKCPICSPGEALSKTQHEMEEMEENDNVTLSEMGQDFNFDRLPETNFFEKPEFLDILCRGLYRKAPKISKKTLPKYALFTLFSRRETMDDENQAPHLIDKDKNKKESIFYINSTFDNDENSPLPVDSSGINDWMMY